MKWEEIESILSICLCNAVMQPHQRAPAGTERSDQRQRNVTGRTRLSLLQVRMPQQLPQHYMFVCNSVLY